MAYMMWEHISFSQQNHQSVCCFCLAIQRMEAIILDNLSPKCVFTWVCLTKLVSVTHVTSDVLSQGTRVGKMSV